MAKRKITASPQNRTAVTQATKLIALNLILWNSRVVARIKE
jgi:hypothetical protein